LLFVANFAITDGYNSISKQISSDALLLVANPMQLFRTHHCNTFARTTSPLPRHGVKFGAC
jgi:hypothetical protein